jgi:transmembrane sensor
MEGNSLSPDAMIAAERWYTRLKAPDCTDFERAQFRRWLAVPKHADAYAATDRLWRSVGALAGHPELEHLSRRALAASTPASWRLSCRFLAAASLAVALLCGAVLFAGRSHAVPTIVYATTSDRRAEIQLADRTEVVLNSSTEIEVSFRSDARHIKVGKGEALFTVSQDKKRPFKVEVGDGEVTALGTRFQVRNEAHYVTVTLLEGRVALDRGGMGEHSQLKPGDQVRFAAGHPDVARRTVDPDVVASWTTGRLRFRATPLADALDEINRYSSTQIHVADPELARFPISGTFAIGDGASVLSALQSLLSVRTVQESDPDTSSRFTLIVPR